MNNWTAQEAGGGESGPAIQIQIKQETELIIDDQEQEQQWPSPKIEEGENEYQQRHTDYEYNGYSIRFLDQEEDREIGDDSQDFGYFNDDSVDNDVFDDDNEEETYTSATNRHNSTDCLTAEEADYKFRKYTESYKKIVDLQNLNYILIICPICCQTMKTFSGWTRHMSVKHPDFSEEMKTHYRDMERGKAVCKHCSQTVQHNVNHLLHYFTKHRPNTEALFECQMCRERVLSTLSIVKHLDEKHNQFNDLYRQCPLCCEIFPDRRQMRHHFRELHHAEFMEKFSFICHLCRHPRFDKEEHLYDHLINLHRLCGPEWDTSNFRAIDDDGLKFACLTCQKTCHNTGPYILLKHHLKHKNNCNWFCKFCLNKFNFNETLHFCNKMYKHFQKSTGGEEDGISPSLPTTSKSSRSGRASATRKQNEEDWQEFENYIKHCCPFCNQEFEKFQEWQVHLRQNHFTNTLKGLNMTSVENDIQKLRCIECNTIIPTSFIDLYTHCFQHLPYKPYKCRHCNQSIENYRNALQHCLNKCKESNGLLYTNEDLMLRHKLANDASNSILIFCPLCEGQQFSSPEDIEVHFETVHKNFEEHFEKSEHASTMVCKECKHTVEADKIHLCVSHYIEHLDEGPFKCVFCQRSYLTYERCRIHVNRYHMAQVKLKPHLKSQPVRSYTQKLPPKRPVPNGIGVCLYKANILNEFSEFMTYACPECNTPFSTLTAWNDHINAHHTFFEERNLSFFDSASGKNKCRECNIVVCTSVSQRQKHKMTHMPYKAYVCTLCHTRTTTSGLLYSHLRRIHFSKGTFECPICPVNLNNAYERSVHVNKTHPRSEWPEHMCLICYRNYTCLRSHMLTHDNDRPKYNCPICNVAIVYMTDMRIHMEKKHNQKVDDDFKLERTRQSKREQSPVREEPTISGKKMKINL